MIPHPDFKAPPRIIEDGEGWEQLRRAKFGPCRVCGNSFLTHLHHVLPRSERGDDVPANLIPLCRAHHQALHDGDRDIALLVGLTLTPAEVAYAVGKKSAAWLERRYGVKEAA